MNLDKLGELDSMSRNFFAQLRKISSYKESGHIYQYQATKRGNDIITDKIQVIQEIKEQYLTKQGPKTFLFENRSLVSIKRNG
jgi:hypothetical protein